MTTRVIAGRPHSPVGLGTATLTFAGVDERTAVATVHAALDGGATWVDTAYAYTTAGTANHSERLVARALRTHPRGSDAMVVTKGGHHRAGPGFLVDGRPATLHRQCDESLRALGVERVGLYLLHKPDPQVPVEESAGALAELQAAGKVAAVGLSNVTVEQLDAACAVAPVVAVQNHLSPQDRSDLPMVAVCADRGIAYLAYSPLGGRSRIDGLSRSLPGLSQVARRHGVSEQRAALAWLLARSPAVSVVVGARRPGSTADSVAAADLTLDADDLRLLPG
ncbi:aldo/keto reductase [Cellulomonas aerilata]|uniref:Oxidoreductase n=1 Tax=Cellulomonas aerilata TaxID=515326 RepID=A0A512DCR2_9CELL|nr:aldo/keto reductase [Cellulomonas aerilata]GEO34256.1 oxidoreductase [Cellulomonas aerilata]